MINVYFQNTSRPDVYQEKKCKQSDLDYRLIKYIVSNSAFTLNTKLLLLNFK